MGLVALQHVKSSQTRVQTQVLCTGRQILNHWTTREIHAVVLICILFIQYFKTEATFSLFKDHCVSLVTYLFIYFYHFYICMLDFSSKNSGGG